MRWPGFLQPSSFLFCCFLYSLFFLCRGPAAFFCCCCCCCCCWGEKKMKRRRTDGERGGSGARFNPKAIGLHNSLRLAAIFSALCPQCMCLVPSGRESRACAICVVFISCRPLALLLLDRHHSFRASRFRCFWKKKKRLELQAEPSRAEPREWER